MNQGISSKFSWEQRNADLWTAHDTHHNYFKALPPSVACKHAVQWLIGPLGEIVCSYCLINIRNGSTKPTMVILSLRRADLVL